MKQTLLLISLLAAVAYFIAHGGNFGNQHVRSRSMEGSMMGHAGGVQIDVLYSDEIRPWMEEVHDLFVKEHPEVQVTLRRMRSLQAVGAILSGSQKPTIWIPGSYTAVNYLAHLWQEKYGEPVFASEGQYRPVPLLMSPMIWMIWPEARQRMVDAGIEQPWAQLGCWGVARTSYDSPPDDSPPEEAAPEEEGKPATAEGAAEPVLSAPEPAVSFRFHHPDPSVSVAGLQSLYLMVLEYQGRVDAMTQDDISGDLLQWLDECERRIPEFVQSEDKLGDAMLRFGAGYTDVVAISEAQALQLLAAVEGKPEAMPELYYPPTTVAFEYPVAIVSPQHMSEDVLQAAHTWSVFLQSQEIQERAVKYGWRPVHPDVSLRSGEENPFLSLARYQVVIDLPTPVPAPSGSVSRKLISTWRQITGR